MVWVVAVEGGWCWLGWLVAVGVDLLEPAGGCRHPGQDPRAGEGRVVDGAWWQLVAVGGGWRFAACLLV